MFCCRSCLCGSGQRSRQPRQQAAATRHRRWREQAAAPRKFRKCRQPRAQQPQLRKEAQSRHLLQLCWLQLLDSRSSRLCTLRKCRHPRAQQPQLRLEAQSRHLWQLCVMQLLHSRSRLLLLLLVNSRSQCCSAPMPGPCLTSSKLSALQLQSQQAE